MGFRKDVQILRGLAVLLVVLFHLGLPWFDSGFLGVDVFFVISGYLMAQLYDPTNKTTFFRKRAIRLLPAYFATVLATTMAAVFITTPNDFAQVAAQGGFATFFLSNVGFWSETSYFHKAAYVPLLHLWSLAVEIQFYLLVPILFFFLRRTRVAGYAMLTLASALACFYVLGISPKTSFFWLPFRLWEFLLGFGVGMYAHALHFRPSLRWAGMLGLAVILGIPFLPIQGEALSFLHGHPGFSALVICLATAAVLLFGIPATVLTTAPATVLEKLGNWSYSIYLAHFPVIVLLLYQPFSGTLLKAENTYQFLGVLGLVVIASAALYGFVEAPMRRHEFRPLPIGVAAAAIIGIGAAGAWAQALAMPPAERAIYEAWTDRSQYRCGKIPRILHPSARSCELSHLTTPTAHVLLVGDSHADSIKTSFVEVAAEKNTAVHFMTENTPLLPGGMNPAALVQEASNHGTRAIILHYTRDASKLIPLEQLLASAAKHDILVAFIMPVPEWDKHVPRMLWEKEKRGSPLLRLTREDDARANTALQEKLAALRGPGLRVYDVRDALCTPDCLLADKKGRVLYFDAHHLTLSGAALLRPVFDRVVHDVLWTAKERVTPPPRE